MCVGDIASNMRITPLPTDGIKTFIYPVKDLAKAETLYGELLGVEPYMGMRLTASASTSKARMSVWILMAKARG